MFLLELLSKDKIQYLKYIGIGIVVIYLLTAIYGLYNGISSLFIENKDKTIGRQEVIIDDMILINKEQSDELNRSISLTNITYDIINDAIADAIVIDKKEEELSRKKEKVKRYVRDVRDDDGVNAIKAKTNDPDVMSLDINKTAYENGGRVIATNVNDMLEYLKEYE